MLRRIRTLSLSAALVMAVLTSATLESGAAAEDQGFGAIIGGIAPEVRLEQAYDFFLDTAAQLYLLDGKAAVGDDGACALERDPVGQRQCLFRASDTASARLRYMHGSVYLGVDLYRAPPDGVRMQIYVLDGDTRQAGNSEKLYCELRQRLAGRFGDMQPAGLQLSPQVTCP